MKRHLSLLILTLISFNTIKSQLDFNNKNNGVFYQSFNVQNNSQELKRFALDNTGNIVDSIKFSSDSSTKKPIAGHFYIKNYSGKATILNLSGESITEAEIQMNQGVDISGLQSGCYVIQLEGKQSQLLVKQ